MHKSLLWIKGSLWNNPAYITYIGTSHLTMIGMDGFNHIITDLGIFNIFAKLHNISNSKWNITQLILN